MLWSLLLYKDEKVTFSSKINLRMRLFKASNFSLSRAPRKCPTQISPISLLSNKCCVVHSVPCEFIQIESLYDCVCNCLQRLREEILIMKKYFVTCREALESKLLLQVCV